MTSPLLATRAAPATNDTYFVVTPDDVVSIDAYPRADFGPALSCLIEQEVFGHRYEIEPDPLARLFSSFGFEWEPLSEPGHMRFIGHAVQMLSDAKDHAARTAALILGGLSVPALQVDGVCLVDPSSPAMREYLKMTSSDPGLYGDSPHEVRCGGRSYMLRQTSCLQKFAVGLDRPLAAESLPVALSEISDSFRGEATDSLQLAYRLRRFHLPESHVHTKSLADAVELSQQLHSRILRAVSELDSELVLLISATSDFAAVHHDYFKQLASQAKSPALLKVSPPGTMCQDGIEVDVEYKLIDSMGCCRELSTFQIDTQITKNFGMRCDDGTTPATIHAVFTGSVERYIYFSLDRIVRLQGAGIRCHLPLWLTPVVARVVPADAAAVPAATTVAHRLSAAGVRTELDDRCFDSVESAIADADSLLVPYVLLVRASDAAARRLRVRYLGSGLVNDRDIADLITELTTVEPAGANGFRSLSTHSFNNVRTSREVS